MHRQHRRLEQPHDRGGHGPVAALLRWRLARHLPGGHHLPERGAFVWKRVVFQCGSCHNSSFTRLPAATSALGGGQQAASGPATTAVQSMPAQRGSTQQRQVGTPGTVLLPALPVSNDLAVMSKSCLLTFCVLSAAAAAGVLLRVPQAAAQVDLRPRAAVAQDRLLHLAVQPAAAPQGELFRLSLWVQAVDFVAQLQRLIQPDPLCGQWC